MEVSSKIHWEDTESAFDGLIKTGEIINLSHVSLNEFLEDAGGLLKPKILDWLQIDGHLKINTTLKYSILLPNSQKPIYRYSPIRSHILRKDFNLNDWWETSVYKPVLEEKDIWDEHSLGYETFKIELMKVNVHFYSPTFDSDLPPENKKKYIEFNKFQNKERIPFVIYANMNDMNGLKLFSYYLKCSYDDSLSTYRSHYDDKDCMEWFVNRLKCLCKFLKNKFQICCGISHLTPEEEAEYSKATHCHICEQQFTPSASPMRDYFKLASRNNNCGSTYSNYRGAAHKSCRQKYQENSHVIPVVFRQLSNEIVHNIIKNINSPIKCEIKIRSDSMRPNDESMDILLTSIEKYICFDINVMHEEHEMKFRFISFDRLTQGLVDNSLLTDYPNLKSVFWDISDDNLKLLCNDNIMNPYNIVGGVDILSKSLKALLSSKVIDVSEYNLNKKLWNTFNIKDLTDYMKLYMKRDVLLLSDLSENFRNSCLDIYRLDPLHYCTLASFAWDSMMLKTKQKLEIVNDENMLSFIEKGIRGGFSQVSKKRCVANNKYMPTYDPTKKSIQLMYFDVNSQYSSVMVQYLPYGGFEWDDKWLDMDIEKCRHEIMNVLDDSTTGYILEVDLEYPENLHDSHCDLPFCVEKKCPPNGKSKNKDVLLATLSDKRHYILHYRNLRQALEYGLKLKTIHKVLKFKQSSWMKEYIEDNIKHRIITKNKFENQLFKLMNNSVYGKSMERPSKYVNTIVISTKEKAKKMIAEPNFKSSRIFDRNLVTMDFYTTRISMRKPIYLGMTILEISKVCLLEFHHGYMKKIYDKNLTLAYTDTDSLIYELKNHDIYKLMKHDCHVRFDTSNYPSTSSQENVWEMPTVNKLKSGLMKDVNGGKIMTEFIGLKRKIYCYRCINWNGTNEEVIKGVKKPHKIQVKDFQKCLEIFIEDVRRNAMKSKYMFGLKPYDNKRYFFPNSYESLPWGHYSIPDQTPPMQVD